MNLTCIIIFSYTVMIPKDANEAIDIHQGAIRFPVKHHPYSMVLSS